jgi:hypothetical protein
VWLAIWNDQTIQYLLTVAVQAAGSVVVAAFQRVTSNITKASDHSGHV